VDVNPLRTGWKRGRLIHRGEQLAQGLFADGRPKDGSKKSVLMENLLDNRFSVDPSFGRLGVLFHPEKMELASPHPGPFFWRVAPPPMVLLLVDQLLVWELAHLSAGWRGGGASGGVSGTVAALTTPQFLRSEPVWQRFSASCPSAVLQLCLGLCQ
jgi:hypothetical protein